MTTNVIMPQLGESVVEGTVTRWLKSKGETIEEFEALLEVNTDKVDTEIPAPAGGTVLRVYVGEGTTVTAGTVLAVIGEPGEDVPDAPSTPEPSAVEASAAKPRTEAAKGKADLGFISPVVARMANEHALDLRLIRGTGTGGRITKKDVRAYLEAQGEWTGVAPWERPALGELFRPSEEIFGDGKTRRVEVVPAAGTVVPLDAVRRSIAEHMVRSVHTSPHVTTVMEADLSRVVAHRQAHREVFRRDGVNLTFTAYFVAAAVTALKAHPMVNASWTEKGIALHRPIHVGVAVSLGEKGLIVPVIRDADQKSLLKLAAEVNDLAGRARERKLIPDEVQGGTFTITNHGVAGSLFATPIIHQPQCAILGVGAIQKRAVVINDAIAIRPMAYLSLTFDHRILDGAAADAFLGTIVARLQEWA